MKVNSNGEIIWEKSYSNEGPVYAITPTSDGGYLLGKGTTYDSMSGSGYLMKVNSNGEKIWEKSYSNEGPVYAICESK